MENKKTKELSLLADIRPNGLIELRSPFLFTIKERKIEIDHVKANYSISNNRIQFQFKRKVTLGTTTPSILGNRIRFTIGRHLKQLYVDPKHLIGQYRVHVLDSDWSYVTQDSWFIIQI